MGLLCFRGGEQVDEESFKPHLAALLRLEHIGVFLGAGASKCVGGKGISELWNDFLTKHKESALRFQEQGFVAESQIGLNGPVRAQDLPNIEKLLDSLEIAKIDWQRRVPKSRNLKVLVKDIDNLLNCVISAAILNKEYWRSPWEDLDGFDSHKKLLQRLIGARQPGQSSPWLFTTNYDLAVEWAAESIGIHVHTGFIGIHNRSFSPQSFDIGMHNSKARGEARFGCNDIYLAKLHGSLSWYRHGEITFRELSSSEMWRKIRPVIDGKKEFDESLVVFPRAAKYIQTIGFLSGEMFRRFSDFLAQPQSCLLIYGYSFGDEHLNRLLRSSLLNPTLQLVIFLPELMGMEAEAISTLKKGIKDFIDYKSPRITFVGGGEPSYFDKAVDMLPDPILFDLPERELRQLMAKEKN